MLLVQNRPASFLPVILCVFLWPSCSSESGTKTDTSAYEEAAETNASFQLNQKADSAIYNGDYQLAMSLLQAAIDSAGAEGDSTAYYDSKLDLACLFERLGQLDKSLEIGEPTLAAFLRSGDTLRIGRAYSTLAAFYGRAKMPEKNMEAARKGFEILKNNPSLPHRCAAYNQMAFTYSDAGDWASARPLLDSALHFMTLSGETLLIPGLQLNLGDCYRHLGDWSKAEYYLNASRIGADSMQQTHIYAKTLGRLSEVAESTDKPALALALYKRSNVIMDSIFSEKNAKRLQDLEVSFKTREKDQEIAFLQLVKEKEVARRNALVLLLVLSLSLVALYVVFMKRRDDSIKKELEANKQHMQEVAALLTRKNAQIVELEELMSSSPSGNMPEAANVESGPAPDALYNSRILTQEDWELFKHYFERSHPGFIFRLRSKFPDLSTAEERLFLLLKLNFNRSEIASTLGISPDSVKKGRQRLRKKLALDSDDDLEKFVRAI